jgi:BirA family biotin operon repressor/biotin-[acetyl-CoA-carboxylase] ligase
LILAGEQTAGRGRGANAWWSGPGALTCTLVADPSLMGIAPERFGFVSLATALAIAAATRALRPGESVMLKWPNDVFIHDRKLAGVLVEIPPARPQRIAIGVGVNVNNSFAKAPSHVAGIGVALCDCAGAEFGIDDVLSPLLRELDQRLRSLAYNAGLIVAEFREHCLLTDREVTILANEAPITGRCLGIDDQGALRIETPSGERRCFGGVVQSSKKNNV